MLEKLIRYLDEREVVDMRGQCLHGNRGLAALARQAGFEPANEPGQGITNLKLSLR